MAVNTQKLLPGSKSTSVLAKLGATKIIPSTSIKRKTTNISKSGALAKQDEPGQIVRTLTDIDIRLKNLLKEEQKQQSQKRKQKEKADFEKQEKKLEAPKEAKKFKLPSLSLPGASFLDRIKRFLFFTALGWLFTKFQDQLPKLEGIVKTITGVYGVAENIFKALLGGLVNFIDIGYQTYDGLRKKVEDIGGKDAVKTFDEFSSHLNKLINGAIMASMLIISTAPKKPNAPSGAGASAGVPRPATPKSISGFGGGTEMTPGRYRAPGQSSSRGFALEKARKGLSFEQSVAARQAAKVGPAAKGARFGAGRIPIIGPLITFVVRTTVYGEKPQKAAAAAVGMGIGQAIGTFIGSLGAGALGLGTAGLGAFVAPLIIGAGSVIGGLVGEWIGAKLYDFIVGSSNKPQRKAAGGPVTRGGKTQGAPTRSIKISRRRPPKSKPKQSQPGKDVGGKKKIRELYPDPSVRTDIEGQQKGAWWNLLPPIPALKENATQDEIKKRNEKIAERDKKIKALPNSYKALTGVAKILKDIPFGIGALMGGAVDIALGQKLPNNAIDNLSNGVSYLINAIANRQVSTSLSGIEKEISKMQGGGAVPRLKDFTRDEFGLGKDIGKALDGMIRKKVDEAIREVQKQLMPGKYGEGGAAGGGGGRGGTGPYGAPGRLGPGGPITTVPGIVDQQGRPVRFASTAAAAFILMMEDAKKEKKPFKGSDIASTYRDPELNERVGGAENSPHLYGLAADIHGSTGSWIRSKGRDYGWVPYDYEGTHGGHYEYRGGGKKEKPTQTLPDIFKPQPKQQPGQLPDIFKQEPKSSISPIFQLPGQKSTSSSEVFLTGIYKTAANIIAGYESSSSGGYNAMNRGRGGDSPEGPKKYFGKNLTDMTIGEVIDLQSKGRKTLNAAGRYQFVGNTLPSAMRNAGLKSGDKFSSINQDKMFLFTLQESGHGPWTGPWGLGKYSKEELKLLDEAVKKIRKEGPQGPQKPGYGGNMQGGGYIPKQSPKNKSSSLSMYPSYSAEGGIMIAIQPMIIEKTIPVPSGRRGGGGAVVFPIAGVNNSNMQSLSRG